MPDIFNTQYDEKTSPEESDYFKLLTKIYKGIGNCWSWEREGGEAYNAHCFGDIKTDFVVLKGWVSPESVNNLK